jgi:hypothetical protein
MNRLYIEPIGGLANRMRVIASALEFQKRYGCEVYCIWNENSELNAPFEDLFETVEGLHLIRKKPKFNKLRYSFRSNQFLNQLLKAYNKLLGFDYFIKAHQVAKLVKNEELHSIVANNTGAIYIESWGIDYNWDTKIINDIFQLKKDIIDKVEANLSEFGVFTEVVGLHIRRTDNVEAIKNSPIELFINEIENKIKQNNNVGFFLATDDKDIGFLLQKLYPGIILVYDKNLSRDSLEGIQDALVDMYTLSKTTFIYGSHYSSFSTMAGKIGGINCFRLHKNSK